MRQARPRTDAHGGLCRLNSPELRCALHACSDSSVLGAPRRPPRPREQHRYPGLTWVPATSTVTGVSSGSSDTRSVLPFATASTTAGSGLPLPADCSSSSALKPARAYRASSHGRTSRQRASSALHRQTPVERAGRERTLGRRALCARQRRHVLQASRPRRHSELEPVKPWASVDSSVGHQPGVRFVLSKSAVHAPLSRGPAPSPRQPAARPPGLHSTASAPAPRRSRAPARHASRSSAEASSGRARPATDSSASSRVHPERLTDSHAQPLCSVFADGGGETRAFAQPAATTDSAKFSFCGVRNTLPNSRPGTLSSL